MPGFRTPGRGREGVTITGTSTLTNWDVGKTVFVNSSGATTVTLPNPATCSAGDDILIINIADQNLIISLDEKIISKNALTADSVTFSTAGELIGSAAMCVCTGTKWCVLPIAEEAVSLTVTSD